MADLDIWIRVAKDYSISQYTKPELSLSAETKYWLQGVDKGHPHVTRFGNSFTLFNYRFFNSVLDECEIIEHSFTVKAVTDTIITNLNHGIACSIYDGNDTYILKKFYDVTLEECFYKLFSYLRVYGIYKTWDFIDLHEAIDKKDTEIERLWGIIKDRNKEIDLLKNKAEK